MTPDAVIALQREWRHYSWYDGYGVTMPDDIVLASSEWLAYVMAMADTFPNDDYLAYPTEEECRWAWPDGVTIVFEHPIEIEHVISSQSTHEPGTFEVMPHHTERQACQAIIYYAKQSVQTEVREASPGVVQTRSSPLMGMTEVKMHPVFSIGVDPHDVVQGYVGFGSQIMRSVDTGVSFYARLQAAMMIALGHRLTEVVEPTGMGRHERRRQQRDLPGLRVLQLRSSVAKPESKGGHVAWSHRWLVKGHWRSQPYGEGRKLRRLTWIDPHIKGPSDKPLDVRPTVWVTTP